MASTDFNLARLEFKRADGSGEVLSCHETPSALVRATRASAGSEPPETLPLLVAYFSAEAKGLLPEMGVELPRSKGPLDKALALFDAYVFREVRLDDDGRPLDEGEPDPT